MSRNSSVAVAPCDDPSWLHYTNTVLELGPRGRVVLDLRAPVRNADRAALATLGLRGPFAVITAANPLGRTVDGRQNRRRHARLAAALRARGVRWVAADGVSRDRRHREVGVAAVMTQRVALELARAYGQSAFYWYDGADFSLLGALVETEPTRLPVAN